ncbi:MAG: UvrD-helicase domain-containing protein [Ignavibacteria bacterium]|nr:UvrD-helicase domain-containing protein [Ignavibacteria bacterium]MDH7528419.1 UvrD-helicase domain-containing protein [Ignavibacteria bacterium]
MINLDRLNPKQKEAVTTTEGPVLVVAGAGSGKTLVLTYRIAYLISLGISPSSILALTFTNKAASEMKERIRNLVGKRADYIFMGTFHSIFARILRREAHLIGYSRDYSIYDTDDQENVIKGILKDFNISENHLSPRFIQNVISKAKNKLLFKENGFEKFFGSYNKKLSEIFEEYNRRLKNSNAMDFDDLLIKPIELFSNYPELLQEYRERFNYILVDEYQDTNVAQYYLLKMLVNDNKNICCVGDDAQSIYKWRGAEVRNILDFNKDFPETKIIRLEQNYRSTKSILAVADSVIKNNVYQIEKTLWTSNEQGEKVTVTVCFDERDEANYIAKKIVELINSKKYNPRDIAILYRTNAQSRYFEETLIKSSIPYVIVGGVEFYKRKEVKDVLAYLKLLVNPKDDESFLRVVNFPARGIGDVSIETLRTIALQREKSLFLAIPDLINSENVSDRIKKNFKAFYELIIKYQDLVNQSDFYSVIKTLIDEIGILQLFKEEGTEDSIQRYENVIQLLNSIQEFQAANSDKTLVDYLSEISLIADIDNWEDRKNAIVLMTLHSAKGLEFDVVFIVGCEEGLLPLKRDGEIEDIEEERRLFYVGCTRAKKHLFISYARNRNRFGNSYPQIQSRFIEEIDKTFVDISATPLAEIYLKKNLESRSIITDEFSQVDPFEDYEYSQISKQIKPGSIVEHDVFGKGRVVYLDGYGDYQKVIVEFNSGVRKHLMVKYAKLKVIK